MYGRIACRGTFLAKFCGLATDLFGCQNSQQETSCNLSVSCDLTDELINDIKFRKFLGLCVHSPMFSTAPQGNVKITKKLRGDAVYAMLSLWLWLSCQTNKTDL